jgi:Fe-S oxidoreductase
MTIIDFLIILPFTIGLVCLLVILTADYYRWFSDLSTKSKLKLRNSFTFRWFFSSVLEIFRECLLHLRIYRQNRRLWYMHMSLAFGWFLLIIAGNLEAAIATGRLLGPPWESVFFDYFTRSAPFPGWQDTFFRHLLDLLLLFILSGLFLAIYKRFNSRLLGMKKRPRHKLSDRLAMTFLWFIFPARLVAETLNHTFYGGGGFMTGFLGNFLSLPDNLSFLSDISWIVYSISLGGFFVVLPYSRYMHILTEVPHIFLMKAHIYAQQDKGCTQFQVYACSSCGICLNSCQMAEKNGYRGQNYYFIRKLRDAAGPDKSTIMNCMMCGRCMDACPVRIDTMALRMNERFRINDNLQFDLPYNGQVSLKKTPVRIVFFGGCMSKLTPAVTASMKKIFSYYGEDYIMIDENDPFCCGRPMLLTGQKQAYQKIMKYTRDRILSHQPKLIITPCPICLNMFKSNYFLPVPIVHHSQYLNSFVAQESSATSLSGLKTIYHDPCELGRSLGIHREPRRVLRSLVKLQNTTYREDRALCCGGSLADTEMDASHKKLLAADAIKQMIHNDTHMLATACPVCKISFSSADILPVKDIAEIFVSTLVSEPAREMITARKTRRHTSASHLQ